MGFCEEHGLMSLRLLSFLCSVVVRTFRTTAFRFPFLRITAMVNVGGNIGAMGIANFGKRVTVASDGKVMAKNNATFSRAVASCEALTVFVGNST
jgi:hypothetical protein